MRASGDGRVTPSRPFPPLLIVARQEDGCGRLHMSARWSQKPTYGRSWYTCTADGAGVSLKPSAQQAEREASMVRIWNPALTVVP